MNDLLEALRSRGMRLTPQRRRIVDALSSLEHATPDALAAEIATDGGPPLPLSTVYRGLEALEDLGLVSHTHLDHRSPTYHLTEHANHIHLVCESCHLVDEVPMQAVADLVLRIETERGFRVDVTHLALHGWCAECEPSR